MNLKCAHGILKAMKFQVNSNSRFQKSQSSKRCTELNTTLALKSAGCVVYQQHLLVISEAELQNRASDPATPRGGCQVTVKFPREPLPSHSLVLKLRLGKHLKPSEAPFGPSDLIQPSLNDASQIKQFQLAANNLNNPACRIAG